jgi:stringent starvation protein B
MSEMNDIESTSTRPYLIRAIHEWCCDNGYTPHITVSVNHSVQVPLEYVKDGEIVLNVGLTATTGLQLGNDYIVFKARFSGVARDIMVPVDQVTAIFARENGQGMAFPQISRPEPTAEPESPKPTTSTRPTLTRIK